MQITVCLLQTMIGRYHEFSSGYFDVVVADECHRSIYGTWKHRPHAFRCVSHWAYRHAFPSTSSATHSNSTSAGISSPDYVYTIQKALEDEFLCPYTFATGITHCIAEGVDIEDDHYDPAAFEKKWTNEDTNRKMMEEFDKLAWQTYQSQAPGQKTGPGKSIVFAITKRPRRTAHGIPQRTPS